MKATLLYATTLLLALHVSAASSLYTDAEDDTAVLRAVLEPRCLGDGTRVDVVYLRMPPGYSEAKSKVTRYGPKTEPESESFVHARILQGLLLNAVWSCRGIRMISEHDEEIFWAIGDRRESWRELREAFPGVRNIVEVTIPIYSADHSHATVEEGAACGDTCGAGFRVELEKRGSEWRVVARKQISIA